MDVRNVSKFAPLNYIQIDFHVNDNTIDTATVDQQVSERLLRRSGV